MSLHHASVIYQDVSASIWQCVIQYVIMSDTAVSKPVMLVYGNSIYDFIVSRVGWYCDCLSVYTVYTVSIGQDIMTNQSQTSMPAFVNDM